jgi:hypothetical protein
MISSSVILSPFGFFVHKHKKSNPKGSHFQRIIYSLYATGVNICWTALLAISALKAGALVTVALCVIGIFVNRPLA